MIHDGHRQRMKEKFIQHGLDSFAPHEVLELLLYYALPRADVNPIAHDLIQRFDSLEGVFSASFEELVKVPGIKEHAATLLRLFSEMPRRCAMEVEKEKEVFDSLESVVKYLYRLYEHETHEVVYLLLFDDTMRLIGTREIGKGSFNEVSVSVKVIVEECILSRSSNIILAHNHPKGAPMPSREDMQTTHAIENALEPLQIHLIEHILVAGQSFSAIQLLEEGAARINSANEGANSFLRHFYGVKILSRYLSM